MPLFAALLLGCGEDSQGPAVETRKENSMQPFEAGQIWTYDTRPGEESSRITICLVESDPKLGEIVHIHLSGLRLRNRHAASGQSDQIGHMPYSGEALRAHIKSLESVSADVPAFRDGYREWRLAFEKGDAGVWTASLQEAISVMESTLTQ
ncbi:MAG: hypothetical protein WEH44_05350 [Pirellulaceae bacterium]